MNNNLYRNIINKNINLIDLNSKSSRNSKIKIKNLDINRDFIDNKKIKDNGIKKNSNLNNENEIYENIIINSDISSNLSRHLKKINTDLFNSDYEVSVKSKN